MSCIVVTGATGYVGGHAVRMALANGWDVVAASRCRPVANTPWIPYRLDDPVDATAFPIGATLLHLAADTSSGADDTVEREVAAARRLLGVAKLRHLAIVFVSSQAARRDAPTTYGRAKWRVEQLVLEASGTVVRAGLVYGGQPGGLYGRLLEQVRTAIVLPALLPAPRVQPIHVIDLVDGLLRVARRDDLGGRTLCLGEVDGVSFTAFMRAIGAHRLRRRLFFLPLPTPLLAPAVRVANFVFGLAIDPGRIRSLVDLPAMHCARDLAKLGLRLRSLTSGMQPSGDDRRRLLLREGRALTAYVLGEAPPPTMLLRRYVRAIECVRGGEGVALPAFALRCPVAIGILDGASLLRSAGAAELQWRLEAATALAESSPTFTGRFLMLPGRSGLVTAILSLAAAAICETFCRVMRLLFEPILRRVLTKRDDRP